METSISVTLNSRFTDLALQDPDELEASVSGTCELGKRERSMPIQMKSKNNFLF